VRNKCKGGHANFFVRPQITNLQILSAKASPNISEVPVRKSPIRKFARGKSSVSDPGPQ
jgi:hypothetical protein